MSTLSSINPATGEIFARFEELTDGELEARLARADERFRSWRRLPIPARAALVARAAVVLEAQKERLGRTMTLEMGKTLKAAIAEVEKCAWVCRYYAENGERFLADEEVKSGATRSWIRWLPLGPVLAVMPWNFPFWQVFRFAAPALVAGNVALLKHASNVPQCALAIEEVFKLAGFPDGAFQTLLVGSSRVERIVADDRVVAATLTGSEWAGAAVAAAAGKAIKRTVLELGGSDPFVVMPSADVEAAARVAVTARCVNNGQSCIAAKRFIVHEQVYDRFTRELVARMSALKVGDPLDAATDVGPIVSAAERDKLTQQVAKALASGGTLLTGGAALPGAGFYFSPTVIAGVPRGCAAAKEEIFGPVALLFRARDVDEAISIANETPFGLGSSAWTRDETEQRRFVDELEAGATFVNSMVASDPRLPFGGVKRSGYGRELAAAGMREFLNMKTISVQDPA
ncbi:MAG: NAD-dependent succinate-semialdehyde dehydrogenase [Anaeromyxobacteraceae bacterium]